jgi:hypothetical protein
LFGPPLLEHLADGVIASVAEGAVDEIRELELTRAIHARWLMTERPDLGGRTPRDLLLADQKRRSWDMERRSEQWSRQRHPAVGVSPDSIAYRFGGFGTMEVVLYYDLIRALLPAGWDLAKEEPHSTRETLVWELAGFRDAWLNYPNEGGPWTPAELIESERRRIPVASTGEHLFDDCPICQAMAKDDFGPTFMCFDGHHLELEDEFAFSMCQTREEWDKQQEEYRQFSEEMDRKAKERAAGGEGDDSLVGSVWKTSYVNWDDATAPGASPEGAMFSLAFPLSELVSELQSRPNGEELLKSLNAAYATLRTSEDDIVRESAACDLRDRLEELSRTFPDLTPRCADLQSRLDEVIRLPF